MKPSVRQRTSRQPAGPPPVQEKVDREDLEGRITALENLAVTHATFLQQVNDDAGNMKQIILQITEKIHTLDGYAQNIDKRLLLTISNWLPINSPRGLMRCRSFCKQIYKTIRISGQVNLNRPFNHSHSRLHPKQLHRSRIRAVLRISILGLQHLIRDKLNVRLGLMDKR